MSLTPPNAEDIARKNMGEFGLLTCLGRDGIGTLYRAWQPGVGRLVMVKCFELDGDEEAGERFAREIRSLGRVRHPHIAQVFTSGRENDCLYYAMEAVDGPSLGDLWEQLRVRVQHPSEIDEVIWRDGFNAARDERYRLERPIPGSAQSVHVPADNPNGVALMHGDYLFHIASLMAQVASALEALHKAGIIHRDVKPDNILLTSSGRGALLKDLGAVQASGESQEGMTCFQRRITHYHEFVGTMRYASPEQALGMGRVGIASDFYSLGASFWELFSLRSLFDAEDDTSLQKLKASVLDETPKPLSEIVRRIPPTISRVVEKCLRKNPDERFESAEPLERALRSALPRQPDAGLRGISRTMLLAGALLATACLCMVGFVLHSSDRSESTKDETVVSGDAGIPGNSDRLPEKVVFQPPGFDPAPDRACLHALAIGISDYENDAYDLAFAANDARRFNELFERLANQIGGESAHHDVEPPLLDGAATQKRILKEITAIVGRADKGDLIVITYSGHGKRSEYVEGVKEFYLLPYDFDDSLFGRVIRWGMLRELFAAAVAKGTAVIVIVDACHSGAATSDATGRFRGHQLLEEFETTLSDSVRESPGLYVFAACRGVEMAEESPLAGHGWLSQAFLEALTGEGTPEAEHLAAGGSRNYITLNEVWEYVDHRVAELSARKQRPVYTVYGQENDLSKVKLPRLEKGKPRGS